MDTPSNSNPKLLDSRRIEQLTLLLPDTEPSEDDCEIENEIAEVSIEVQQRIEIIQTLISAQGTDCYGKLQQQAAKKLGITVRSLQRLMKRWREQGLSALTKQQRVDHGAVRISSEWRDFILKTYRDGNRGSRT